MISSFANRATVKWTSAIMGILLAVYMLLGVFWVPSYLAGQVSRFAETQYGLTAETTSSSLNPFTFRYEMGPTRVSHGDTTLFSVKKISINFDPVTTLYSGAFTFGSIELNSPDLRLRRNRSGRLNLQEIFESRQRSPLPEDSDEEGWGLSVERLRLTGGAVSWENRQLETNATIVLRNVGFKARHLHYPLSPQVPFNLQLKVGNGQLRLEGTLKEDRTFRTFYSLENFPLSSLNGFLRGALPGDFTNGQLNTRGRVGGSLVGSELSLESSGGLRNVELSRSPDQSLATVTSIDFGSAQLDLPEKKFSLEDVTVDSPTVNLVRKPDGSLNLLGESSPQRKTKDATYSDTPAQPWFLRVGPTRLRSGKLVFEDQTFDPAMSTRLNDLAGTAGVITSTPGDTVPVELRTFVAERAPLRSRATVSPLEIEETMDLETQLSELVLPPFSPYAIRFVGHRIDGGKLQLSLDYRIRDGLLTGSNELTLNRFNLGDKVNENPIVSAPIKLAVALLKDREGNIQLSIPVEGNLRNPAFQLQGTINQAVGNALQNVVNSPFDFLASLVDVRPENLRSIDFEPGQHQLDEESLSNLDKLTKALQLRPQLQLEIRPIWSEADRRFFAKRQLDDDLKDSGGSAENPTRSREALEKLFDRTFSADRRQELIAKHTRRPDGSFTEQLDRTAYTNDLYERLLNVVETDETKLRTLAVQRAKNIFSALEQRGITPERLFVLDRQGTESTETPVSVPLQLSSE